MVPVQKGAAAVAAEAAAAAVDTHAPPALPGMPSTNELLEVQPNREISVVLQDGSSREMVVDSRLDVYELAYMIAEEIRSEHAYVMEPDDFGPLRSVELLDHQSSLASQQIPLSAKFCVRKTGIVDDFVKVNDIYDNHFLFVVLPSWTGDLLVKDPSTGAWHAVRICLLAGKLLAMSPNDPTLAEAAVLLCDVMSIFSAPDACEDEGWGECAFAVALSSSEEMHFLAKNPEECGAWCALDGWCGFYRANPLLDSSEGFSARLFESGPVVDDVAAWLGVARQARQQPPSSDSSVEVEGTTSPRSLPSSPSDADRGAPPPLASGLESTSPRTAESVPVAPEPEPEHDDEEGDDDVDFLQGDTENSESSDEAVASVKRLQRSSSVEIMAVERLPSPKANSSTLPSAPAAPQPAHAPGMKPATAAAVAAIPSSGRRVSTSNSDESINRVALTQAATHGSPSSATGSPASRIKKFDWRKGSQESSRSARRRSMDGVSTTVEDDEEPDPITAPRNAALQASPPKVTPSYTHNTAHPPTH